MSPMLRASRNIPTTHTTRIMITGMSSAFSSSSFTSTAGFKSENVEFRTVIIYRLQTDMVNIPCFKSTVIQNFKLSLLHNKYQLLLEYWYLDFGIFLYHNTCLQSRDQCHNQGLEVSFQSVNLFCMTCMTLYQIIFILLHTLICIS